MDRSRSIIAVPPGATIKEQIQDRRMNQKEFAARMNMSEKHISRLINGEVQLTGSVALSLELVLGIPANFWNKLEAIYRENLLRVEAENSIDADLEILNRFPYEEMVELGWIYNAENDIEKVINLRKFFEVVELGLLDNRRITKIACRRLDVSEMSDAAMMVWAQKAKLIARDAEAEKLDIEKLEKSVPEIKKNASGNKAGTSKRLKEILSNCGVVLITLPAMKSASICGASFVDGNKAVVCLAEESKETVNNSLFHELGHIVLGHVVQGRDNTEQDEADADAWAEKWAI